jgi:hypothetical protein
MQNNETRWNSTFPMIQRAISKREHIEHFITYQRRQQSPDNVYPLKSSLTTGLASVGGDTEPTQPLYEITMRCQGWAKEGRYGALWEVMIGMEYLLNFFEEQKLIFSPPDGAAGELQNARTSVTRSTAF